MQADSHDDDRERLIVAIEEEISKILSAEYGMAGVLVRLDRQTGDIVSSQAIPDHLKPLILSAATKQAIIKRVREIERGIR